MCILGTELRLSMLDIAAGLRCFNIKSIVDLMLYSVVCVLNRTTLWLLH